MSIKCPKCSADNPDTKQFCGDCGTQLIPSADIAAPTKTIDKPVQDLSRGTLFAERYEIIEELGRGGMGKVFRVEDTKIKEEVALKIIKPEISADKETIERFSNELKVARKIAHKNVGRMYHLGDSMEIHYITMEYVAGENLKSMIRMSGQLSMGTAINIAKQVCEGLAEAHRLGVIHRDLKPSNIMVDREGNTRIMDFGLARALKAKGVTGEGVMIGTPGYMSPEQMEGKDVDQLTDIYSLGVMLYEMVTGRLPFEGETPLGIAMKQMGGALEEPKTHNPQISDDLNQMILKCVAKAKKERYQSVGQVLAELNKIEQGIPASQREIPKRKPLTSKETTITLSTRKLFIPAFLIIALAVVGLFVWHPWKKDSVIPFSERDWILITDFDNQTGDDVFNQSLNTALTVSIQQSKHVNVFPQSRVKETLQRMGREDVGKLDVELGREIAQREGIRAIVACSINQVGDVYDLTASIIDPDTQVAMKTEKSQAKGKDEVLSTLDGLAGKIRKDLGESLRDINEQSVGLPRATTSSLGALKKYAEGNKFWEVRQYEEAASLWKEAIELDPNFALAHASLGGAHYRANERPEGEVHFNKALSLKDQLTEREKLWLPAVVEQWRQNREEAIRHFKIYLSSYPSDINGWAYLGRNHMFLKGYSEALEAFDRVLEIDPLHAQTYINIATSYNMMGNADEAIVNYVEAFKLRPEWVTNSNLNHEYGQAYMRKGDLQKTQEIYGMMLEKDDSAKARGLRSLALLHMYQGKYSAAMDYLKESILIRKTLKHHLSELRDRMYLAIVCIIKGETNAQNEQLQAVDEIRSEIYLEPWWLQIVGKVQARIGNTDKAAGMLDEISSRMNKENRVDRAAFNILKGEIELAKGNNSQAVDLFEMAYKLRTDNYALESLAFGYFLNGDMDQAIANYELLIRKKDLGWEAQEYWIHAHYQLAKAFEQKGDVQSALDYYQRYLDILKGADPSLPTVKDTSKRIAAIRTEIP